MERVELVISKRLGVTVKRDVYDIVHQGEVVVGERRIRIVLVCKSMRFICYVAGGERFGEW